MHSYLRSLTSEKIYVFWFVWNDFEFPGEGFAGVKWHRHSYEPRYNYGSGECERFIEHICSLGLPVIIEEELHHTMELVNRLDGRTAAIIPHLGMLNGGYQRLKDAGLFENPAVYVDTALASIREVEDFAACYGVERILFGSDFPFGNPVYERTKVGKIFNREDLEKVLSQNLLQLLQKRI